MRLISIIGVLLFALPANAQIIPLDTIYSNGMPGTKDIRKLDAKQPTLDEGASEYLKSYQEMFGTPLRRIGYYLMHNAPKERQNPTRAVVIAGKVDDRMLEKVDRMFWHSAWHAVPLWQDKMPENYDLTLVFYSYGPKGLRPKIESVDRSERIIEVKYRLVAHNTHGRLAKHVYTSPMTIALIPIGKFSMGGQFPIGGVKMDVKITELPAVDADGKELESKVSSDHVSSSVGFYVESHITPR